MTEENCTSSDEFEAEFSEQLKDARSVVLLAAGNEFRGDDRIGYEIARQLGDVPGLKVFFAGVAPEAYSGPIIKEAPSVVLFVDAAHINEKPGKMRLLALEEVKETTFTTHSQHLSFLADRISRECGAKLIIVGIQPRSVEFGEPISSEASRAVKEFVSVVKKSLASRS